MQWQTWFKGIAVTAVVAAGVLGGSAQANRKNTLVVLVESGPNSLDIQSVGANRPAYQTAINMYDRLVRFGTKTLADGTVVYDHTRIEPELAESWTVTPEAITFKLREATFWDGTPVTAHDVKWSFDRKVSIGGFPSVQAKAGSMESPEQFEVVDDRTFRVKLLRKDKLTLPDLAVPTAVIYNSKVAKANASKDDPWAMEYLKRNPAGSGAFIPERWDPGQQLVYKRFEGWKSGPLPKVSRVIFREVPSAANRRALLEKGDADVSLDLPPKDVGEMAGNSKLKLVGVPIENTVWYLGMNVQKPPFNDPRVRQAIAYALPYEQILQTSAYGRGAPLFGASSAKVTAPIWPQATAYNTDLAKARALLKEAGVDAGFEVPFFIDLGNATRVEPIALLVQEALAKLNIKTTIEKVPGANWRAKMQEKSAPLYVNNFGGWLNYPEYFFFWAYDGAGRIFNDMGYKNPRVDELIQIAKFEDDVAKYNAAVTEMVQIAFDEVPRIPLYQPYLDVAMRSNVGGYVHYFHRQLDARWLYKE